jgi:hypothetical protein
MGRKDMAVFGHQRNPCEGFHDDDPYFRGKVEFDHYRFANEVEISEHHSFHGRVGGVAQLGEGTAQQSPAAQGKAAAMHYYRVTGETEGPLGDAQEEAEG